MDSKCESVFKLNSQRLRKSNIFQIMNQTSLTYLYMRYGQYIMNENKPKVITYVLQDEMTALTSRCSPLIFKDSTGNYIFGVLLETREARHKNNDNHKDPFKLSSTYKMSKDISSASPGYFYNIGLFSPSNSLAFEDPEIFKRPNLSPSPMSYALNHSNKGQASTEATFNQSEGGSELFNLTPLLANNLELPSKRRRTSQIKVSEFI